MSEEKGIWGQKEEKKIISTKIIIFSAAIGKIFSYLLIKYMRRSFIAVSLKFVFDGPDKNAPVHLWP